MSISRSLRQPIVYEYMCYRVIDESLLEGADDDLAGTGAKPAELLTSCRNSLLLKNCCEIPTQCNSVAFTHQRHSQWAHPLPKQPKQQPALLDVNILSACHLHRRPMPLPHPLLQQANQQLQVQPYILKHRPEIHVMNVSSIVSVLY